MVGMHAKQLRAMCHLLPGVGVFTPIPGQLTYNSKYTKSLGDDRQGQCTLCSGTVSAYACMHGTPDLVSWSQTVSKQ